MKILTFRDPAGNPLAVRSDRIVAVCVGQLAQHLPKSTILFVWTKGVIAFAVSEEPDVVAERWIGTFSKDEAPEIVKYTDQGNDPVYVRACAVVVAHHFAGSPGGTKLFIDELAETLDVFEPVSKVAEDVAAAFEVEVEQCPRIMLVTGKITC